ncbi:MAG: hypothetical protein A2148_00865 [Chloroflexi bacterium RBG_16_68_14]|nr:MAG: hypothetical protein A2148_00865 [Chloroflexi bacterium RBG_16_68_14]
MFHDEEKAQTRRRQADTAIQLARESRWEEAVAANRAILKLFPNDADSHNRLGKALMELGRYQDAKKAYRKALELDSTNQIARKNLERLTVLARTGAAQADTSHVDPSLFIEEMGKSAVTKLQEMVPEVLATLNAGDRVELRPRGSTLAAETPKGEFIGVVEPKLRVRLLKLMEGGNKYAAAVTSLSGDACRIIIKETYQDPSQAGRPSFPTAVPTESMRPYTKERLLRHGAQVEELELAEEAEEEIEGEGRETWENEHVLQEGHVRLNEAAAAEEAEDEELEE